MLFALLWHNEWHLTMGRWRIDHPAPDSVWNTLIIPNDRVQLSAWRVKADILSRGGGITRQWVWNDNDFREVWTLMVWGPNRAGQRPFAHLERLIHWGTQETETAFFRDQFSLLTSCLLACILLAYWLFFSVYRAHINALFCMTIF